MHVNFLFNIKLNGQKICLQKVESLLCINKAKPLSWSYLYNTHKQKEDSNSFFFFFFG